MDFQPPVKRPRNEENPPQDARQTPNSSFPPFSRSPTEIWFEDGNIIIVCGTTGFRVHRGILALNSSVFRDMFAIGNPNADCNETFEGCVVVRLPDDATDMLRLLKTLYLRNYARKGTMIDFQVLASLFKLTTKYAFDELRPELVEHLQSMFPTTLDEFNSEASMAFFPHPFDPAVAVEFGLKYRIPSIVLVACYHTAQDSVKVLLDGPPQAPRELDRAAERLCLIFREKLVKIIGEIMRTAQRFNRTPWSTSSTSGMQCSAPCAGFGDETRHVIEQGYRELDTDIFLVRPGSSLFMYLLRRSGARIPCSSCQKRLEEFEADIASQIWKRLPEACDYGNWESVHHAQMVASRA